MDELIKFLSDAPESCAQCVHSEWVDDPFATGDSPGGWECGNFHCEYAEAEVNLTSKCDVLERKISNIEDETLRAAPSELYELLDEAVEALERGWR